MGYQPIDVEAAGVDDDEHLEDLVDRPHLGLARVRVRVRVSVRARVRVRVGVRARVRVRVGARARARVRRPHLGLVLSREAEGREAHLVRVRDRVRARVRVKGEW